MSPKLTPDLIPKQSLKLRQKFGVWKLTLLGLSSILGTGVFVGIALATKVAGAGAIGAVVLAALVALCNELSAAQLSINRSATSGTYAYGYYYLSPWIGFTAGWAFLLAKVASAATAALGFAGYFLNALGQTEILWLIPIALLLVALLTVILLSGLHHAGFSSPLIVSATLVSLLFFSAIGLPIALSRDGFALPPGLVSKDSIPQFLQATALLFVAYAGYGRLAYLSPAVREPRRVIPQAALLTLFITLLLYLGVAIVGVGTLGAEALGNEVEAYIAPLCTAAHHFAVPGSPQIVAIGAVTALLAALLHLIMDCAYMLQAMAQQQDIPRRFARFNAAGTTPTLAIMTVCGAIACFISLGNVKTIWSFSAFAILIYFAITHLTVLKLSAQERLYPRAFTQFGLAVCLFLAFWVDWQVWLTSLGLLGIGLIWRGINQRVEQSEE